jgi:hypothetical protein
MIPAHERPCLCDGRAYTCHRHALAYRDLRALARNRTVPDDMFLAALRRSMNDDLHRLLEEETA